MPTIVYNGSVDDATGLNRVPSVSLSGSGGSAEGIIQSVTARMTFSTTASSNYYNVTVTLQHGSGSVSATETVKMNSSTASGGQFDFTFTGLTVDQVNSIEAVTVSCAANSGKIFIKGKQSITVEYLPVSAVEAPSDLSLSAESVAPGAKITLSWSGASAGENNPIVGYEVFRASDPSGPYSLLTSVSATDTLGSTIVIAPTSNGASYHYRVATLGTYDGYHSEKSVGSVTLTCSFDAVSAPTAITLNATNVAPGAELTLSWAGATGGSNNSIVGYNVYRATSETGGYSLLSIVTTDATSGSLVVTAPTKNDAAYYYKVQTVGSLAGHDSDLSSAYAVLTCTVSLPGAPTQVTIAGETSAYVLPGATVTLAWSGATAGANNPITGYKVYTNGLPTGSTHSASTHSIEVSASEDTGGVMTYRVQTIGEHSYSVLSAECAVYSYTDPIAPVSLNVSNDAPATNARVTLSWVGGNAGHYNDIVGYRVYRATSENGAKTQVAQVSVTASHASCYVTAPPSVGSRYYYWVETIGSRSSSGLSDTFTSITASKEPESVDGDTTVVVPKPTGYKKRGFIFGDYDTAAYGWTLTGWTFPEPEPQTSYVNIHGRSAGPLDLTAALTGGDTRFGSRELNALFELSEGTRTERNDIIEEMVNLLHGMREEIIFPDDSTRYAVGRLSVNLGYSDMAHAEVSVQAVCEPWRYNQQETRVSLMATEDTNIVVLSNAGRRILVPDVVVSGTGASVVLTCGEYSWTLSEGSYRLPDLELRKGNTFLTYSGYGTITLRYREAIL